MTVLVLTQRFDPTADYVVEELNRRGVDVFRCDIGDFPHMLTVTGVLSASGTGWSTHLESSGRKLSLEDVSGVYHRRPSAFRFDNMPDPVAQWADNEARMGVSGLLMADARWLNHPHRIRYAEYKPVQLQEAVQAGLTIPRTVITNNPPAVRAFADEVGEVIYKPLSSPVLDEGVATGRLLYTAVVAPEHLAEAEGIAATAHMFQERVKHTGAVRLTVVDGQMFAAAIHAATDAAQLDWRSDYSALTYQVVPVPEDVRRGVVSLMAALQLRYGAFDFLVTTEGWTFLEVNPNGQWAWIEDRTGLPIAAALATALTRGIC
ncbi:ATP-grasp ribosomal peptide maturase [Streptomyces sp. NPDC090052]|uniref:ATP-grasp ribosomal peptide maturase n=1 Tax=unclassified Streptomyces TaxID=2593676 RepID=UPI0022576019|nr:ATP-grasp ribosomal peptide maturase [Streptomyces sp. NBC_01306]MCX4722967.1 ATP-grasp ribosomal peptide maturase [Streptomyces sp. NBC_01306]WSX45504.1 ATP-grasp ribosomal peptide maturase [Streptomyces sp. NBC_00963]